MILNNTEVVMGPSIFSNVIMRNAGKCYSLIIVAMDANGIPYMWNQAYTDNAATIRSMVITFIERADQLLLPHQSITLVTDNAHEFNAIRNEVQLFPYQIPSVICEYHNAGIVFFRISPDNDYEFTHNNGGVQTIINTLEISASLYAAQNALYQGSPWIKNLLIRFFRLFDNIHVAVKDNFRYLIIDINMFVC